MVFGPCQRRVDITGFLLLWRLLHLTLNLRYTPVDRAPWRARYELKRQLTPKQRQQQNDREGNPEKPK